MDYTTGAGNVGTVEGGIRNDTVGRQHTHGEYDGGRNCPRSPHGQLRIPDGCTGRRPAHTHHRRHLGTRGDWPSRQTRLRRNLGSPTIQLLPLVVGHQVLVSCIEGLDILAKPQPEILSVTKSPSSQLEQLLSTTTRKGCPMSRLWDSGTGPPGTRAYGAK